MSAALVNAQQSIATVIETVIDWIIPHEAIQPIDIEAVTIAIDDVLTDGEHQIKVVAKGNCPYIACPEEWADYSVAGTWVYVWSLTPDFTDWIPEAALVKALVIEEWAVA